MKKLKDLFKKTFPAVTFDEDLKRHCSFYVGGKADYFYLLKDTDELPALIDFARKHKLHWLLIGRGSNVLFDDRGFRGLIIQNVSDRITIDKNQITADSGVMISRLIAESLKQNLSGLEKWIGLPGTVGGAVRGNAGCNGLETKNILVKALILNPLSGKTREVKKNYFKFSYRHSRLKNSRSIVLQATFQLKKSTLTPQKQQKILAEINKSRTDKQPAGLSSGSFFKNPSAANPAGQLIDRAGLKGKIIGKAQISPKHGNFFMNTGGATASDIRRLAQLARRTVKAKFRITLKEEVQILSPFGKRKL